MRAKKGVSVNGLHISMRQVLPVCGKLWREHGKECVVTAGNEGNPLDRVHSIGSLHYYGRAVDLRTRYFDKFTQKKVKAKLQDLLGSDYDVVIERTHMHVEYDPKL